MCGIVGYVGPRNASPILIDLIKKLSYRGYDSTGMCLGRTNNSNEIIKNAGDINDLLPLIPADNLSQIGIGHTRWATHGSPSVANAHPHTSSGISVVHNGIVSNYKQIKTQLEGEGYSFTSDTDTEVIPHLIHHIIDTTSVCLMDATRIAMSKLEGSYAIAVIDDGCDRIIVARRGSPIIIGIGDGEIFIASDISALLSHAKNVIVMQDGEIASIGETAAFFDNDGNPIIKTPETIDWHTTAPEKGGYEHFMLKEIYEQAQAVEDTISAHTNELKTHAEIELPFSDDEIRAAAQIQIVACGTSYNAGLLGAYIIEELTGIHTDVYMASEFRYTKRIPTERVITIALTQSGETADTLAAIRTAKSHGDKTLAIVNVEGSSISHEVDGTMHTKAGYEIGVAATKTFTTQAVALLLFASYCAKVKTEKAADEMDVMGYLKTLPNLINRTLENITRTDQDGQCPITKCAMQLSIAQDYFFIGRNIQYPIALEGALKLKEISYAHAEGIAAGELKHGHLAFIDKNIPVVVLVNNGPAYDALISNIMQLKARGATIICIAGEGDKVIGNYADTVLRIPDTHHLLSPILMGVVCQLLAYYIAYDLDRNIDQPRHIAKTVTVE